MLDVSADSSRHGPRFRRYVLRLLDPHTHGLLPNLIALGRIKRPEVGHPPSHSAAPALPSMIVRWRKIATEGLAGLFQREDRGGEGVPKAEYERKVHELYAEIGRLSTELQWLGKRVGGLR